MDPLIGFGLRPGSIRRLSPNGNDACVQNQHTSGAFPNGNAKDA